MINWYVLQSKPQKESFLNSQLNLYRIESYLPGIPSKSSTGKPNLKSFFPGYLFIHIDLIDQGTSHLQWIPGSKGLVSFGGQPASVPDQFIHQLKNKLEEMNKSRRKFTPIHNSGDHVCIIKGPFEGYQAIFDEYLPDKDRVRIFINMLQDNSVYVELPDSYIH